ncbi:MAG: hypothetical protein J6T01_00860 [Kiritimatiellae bacterium]|nr:hypothetical protein [Kiritimatiellia bacterium]
MKRRFYIALGFIAMIVTGAVLLASPWARADGTWGSLSDAAFTACSAVCVTGLSVVDIAAEYSFAGQIALIALVEIGALGMMALGTFLLVAIGRRLSFASEFSLMNAYGVIEIRGVKGLLAWIVCSMLLIEAAGACVLYYRFQDWYVSIFYSVMSFCNAGFGLYPGSLARFADDPFVLVVLAAETVLGGIGFLVIYNLCTFKFLRRKSGAKGRLSLHSAVVLRFSFYLLAAAFVVFAAAEWNWSLKGMDAAKKLWVSFYQAVTPRSCGFCVIPTEALRPSTVQLYECLMFIGGAPGSVAAGVKVTTFAVIVHTIAAMCRGETETTISKRVISYDVVRESIVIVAALFLLGEAVYVLLILIEEGSGIPLGDLFFETVSAITTTGLSVGDTTSRLSAAGRAVIMAAMLCGRLGALTVVMMIGARESKRHLRYPSEEIVVG